MLSGVASDLTSPVRSNSLQDLKTLDRGVRLDYQEVTQRRQIRCRGQENALLPSHWSALKRPHTRGQMWNQVSPEMAEFGPYRIMHE